MKKFSHTILSIILLALSTHSLQAFEIGGAALGAELHYKEYEDHPNINGINKLMLSFGGEKVQDELDFLAQFLQDITFPVMPFLGTQESLGTSTADSHKIRSVSFLQNDKHVYINMRDRIVDDMYVYGFDYVPFPGMASVDSDSIVRQGECSGECWIWLGSRAGYVPILRGVSLESDDMNDHEISEIQAFIDEGNALRLSMNEEGELWGFKYIIQVSWINQAFFSATHFEVSNQGNAVKGSHDYVRPDETTDRAVLKGFKLKYVKNEAGTSTDSHYVKDIIIDLENGSVAFNDGDKDDYFEYNISYATVY